MGTTALPPTLTLSVVPTLSLDMPLLMLWPALWPLPTLWPMPSPTLSSDTPLPLPWLTGLLLLLLPPCPLLAMLRSNRTELGTTRLGLNRTSHLLELTTLHSRNLPSNLQRNCQ